MDAAVIKQLWDVLLWGLGICVTGFLFLAGWAWWIVQKLGEKASYNWIKKNLEESLDKKIDEMQITLNQIRDALVGDFEQRGLIVKQDDIEKDILAMKSNCERLHRAK